MGRELQRVTALYVSAMLLGLQNYNECQFSFPSQVWSRNLPDVQWWERLRTMKSCYRGRSIRKNHGSIKAKTRQPNNKLQVEFLHWHGLREGSAALRVSLVWFHSTMNILVSCIPGMFFAVLPHISHCLHEEEIRNVWGEKLMTLVRIWWYPSWFNEIIRWWSLFSGEKNQVDLDTYVNKVDLDDAYHV